MELLSVIRSAWGWCGIDPAEVLEINAFGNLLIRDAEGLYWRLCPEDVCCEVVASSKEEFDVLLEDQDFQLDWEMAELVAEARRSVGPLEEEVRYCLEIPGVLGGEYGGDNLASTSLLELIRFAGDLARQIKDLPDGTDVQLDVVE